MTEQLFFHFVAADKHLRFDLKNVEVKEGLTLKFDGEPILCEQGLHASKRALDALTYAPPAAEWLCLVRLGGIVAHSDDKSVATERTIVRMLNVRKLLVEFAVWNVEQAFVAVRKIGIEPDKRSIEAIRMVRLWLADKGSKSDLEAAARAAYAAARAAADAADAAARAAGAADAAARAAGAAAGAAGAAAGAAARAADAAAGAAYAADAAGAAGAAARAAQNKQFEKMIQSALTFAELAAQEPALDDEDETDTRRFEVTE